MKKIIIFLYLLVIIFIYSCKDENKEANNDKTKYYIICLEIQKDIKKYEKGKWNGTEYNRIDFNIKEYTKDGTLSEDEKNRINKFVINKTSTITQRYY